jgi:branched-chain amino acid transport system substrate-binding protein
MRTVKVKAPRGPVELDAYDNPIQNVYVSEIQKVDHPVLGEVLINVPIKTYEAVSQFWTWEPEEFLARGQYRR